MDSIIRDFGLSLAADGKKPKTIRTYTDAAAWLARRAELTDNWSAITKTTVREHMAYLNANYSPAYASNQYRALQIFCKWLEAELGISNPMTSLKPPTVPAKLVPVISEPEYAKLAQACAGKRFTVSVPSTNTPRSLVIETRLALGKYTVSWSFGR